MLVSATLSRQDIVELPVTPLSVVIITKNEAQRIGDCLNSVAGLVDEVVVLDSGPQPSP